MLHTLFVKGKILTLSRIFYTIDKSFKLYNMKKLAVLSILALAILIPFNASAQKKDKKKKKKEEKEVVVPAPIEINTSADSISYAFGASIVEGLPQYLTQMKALIDTAAIKSEYNTLIENENDTEKKSALEGTLKFKIDSANTANDISMIKFLEGFESVFNTENSEDNAAYNAGIGIANQVNEMIKGFSSEILDDGESFDRNLFASAFKNKLMKGESLIENPQNLIQERVMAAQSVKQAKEKEMLEKEYAEQKAAGEQFMAENKNKPGVVTLPSGLQYKVITEGNGPMPKRGDLVKVHYHGTLLDGTVFDSSVERGEPISLTVGQLIEGWNEALTMMPTGSKWILYIPYNLAYGERDMGTIKPFSDLIFEIEVISIEE